MIDINNLSCLGGCGSGLGYFVILGMVIGITIFLIMPWIITRKIPKTI